MDILNCGAIVRVKIANIEAIITCAAIRFEKVTYELTYYSDIEQKTIWCNENEFEVSHGDRSVIGFKIN